MMSGMLTGTMRSTGEFLPAYNRRRLHAWILKLFYTRRVLWAFKLNPYEKLNLRFDATIEDVKRQFRKLSLLVHPDKCKHPQASTAFESELYYCASVFLSLQHCLSIRHRVMQS